MLKKGIYRHYKGHEYRVLLIAKHSESLEELVVYQDLEDASKVWARPLWMFQESVDVDGGEQPRFAYLSTESE